MKITREWLTEHGAKCAVNRFSREYPDGVELTTANVKAASDEWDWAWLASKVLPKPYVEMFVSRATPHFDACDIATKPHVIAMMRAVQEFSKLAPHEAWRASAPHREAYLLAVDPHQKARDAATKAEFIRTATEAGVLS